MAGNTNHFNCPKLDTSTITTLSKKAMREYVRIDTIIFPIIRFMCRIMSS